MVDEAKVEAEYVQSNECNLAEYFEYEDNEK